MPMLPARELAYIVNDFGIKGFISAADLLDELLRAKDAFAHPVTIIADPKPPDGAAVDAALDDLMRRTGVNVKTHPSRRDDLALIAYTSGSTGIPKGTTHTPADIMAA